GGSSSRSGAWSSPPWSRLCSCAATWRRTTLAGTERQRMSLDRPLDTRRSILDAAEQLILDRGIGSATTREIARAAGCAEGSIYRYFEDKHALFIELVGTRYAGFFDLVESLPDRAGSSTVRRNLEEVTTSAIDFYYGIVPTA